MERWNGERVTCGRCVRCSAVEILFSPTPCSLEQRILASSHPPSIHILFTVTNSTRKQSRVNWGQAPTQGGPQMADGQVYSTRTAR